VTNMSIGGGILSSESVPPPRSQVENDPSLEQRMLRLERAVEQQGKMSNELVQQGLVMRGILERFAASKNSADAQSGLIGSHKSRATEYMLKHACITRVARIQSVTVISELNLILIAIDMPP
jgi:hypothetical protein